MMISGIDRFPSPGKRCLKHKDIGVSYCNLCAVEEERAEVERLATEGGELREVLGEVMALIDNRWLVRNIEHDDEPLWALNQLSQVRTLSRAAKLLDDPASGTQKVGGSTLDLGRSTQQGYTADNEIEGICCDDYKPRTRPEATYCVNCGTESSGIKDDR